MKSVEEQAVEVIYNAKPIRTYINLQCCYSSAQRIAKALKSAGLLKQPQQKCSGIKGYCKDCRHGDEIHPAGVAHIRCSTIPTKHLHRRDYCSVFEPRKAVSGEK